MIRIRVSGSRCIAAVAMVAGLFGSVTVPTSASTPPGAPESPESQTDELSRRAADPTDSPPNFSFINDVGFSYRDLPDGTPIDDTGYELRFQPVIPFKAWGVANILRMTVPYTIAGPSPEGLGDVTVFNLAILPQAWGRIGIGVVGSFAAATSDVAAHAAAGPAIGFVARASKRLNLGLFNQNVFGNDVAISQIQPIAAYQLGSGWSLSLGDLQWAYDWNREEFVSLPIGVQLGKVLPIAEQPMRFSVNPQYDLKDLPGNGRFRILFTAQLLLPRGDDDLPDEDLRVTLRRRILLSFLVLGCPALAAAQGDGPRGYLYLPKDQNVLIPWYMNLKGSLDPTGSIQLPDAEVEVDLFLVNYHRTFGLAGRYGLFQAVVPAGKVSGEVRLGEHSFHPRDSSGLGDIGLITTVNLAGAPALAPREYAAHPFRASIHATAGVFLPTGDYDPERLLNLGTNRTSFKLGTPINIALGEWIFGKRTVIDVNPFVYLFTANSDLAAGDSRSQDPLWTVEAHLSRDLSKKVWVSLDTRYFNGGETRVDDVPDGNSVEAFALGGTFGWALSKSMSVQATYSERVSSKTEDFDARMIRFRFAYAF